MKGEKQRLNMKRNFVEEILSKKERAKYNEREHILSKRRWAMEAVVHHCKNFVDIHDSDSNSYLTQKKEIHRYIPIGVIACAESYFRAVIKELIDFGAPFSENAANFNKTKDIKFDFAVVQAIQGKQVTVGDFVSHLLPMKSFEDISSTISVLTSKEFLKELKPYFYKDEYFDEDRGYEIFMPSIGNLTQAQINEVGVIYEDVQETFKLRNIFCHEAAEPEIIEVANIYKCFDSTVKFLEATNEFIWDLIDPNRPTSNYDWSVRLSDEFDKLDEELENLVKEIANNGDEVNQEFVEIHEAWKTYREKRGDLVAKEWEGGSGQGIAVCSEEIHVTKNRITELKEDIEKERYLFLKSERLKNQ